MAITVAQLMDQPVAEGFKLIGGAAGLDRIIEKVNLLDFEYDTWEPKGVEPDGLFDEKSVVVTSMIFAKDAPEKILPVMKQLHANGVSALAIKEVYYKELPLDALEYVNEKAMPVFFFDSCNHYSDNIVVSFTKAIEEHSNVDGQEEKVAFLLQDNLGMLNRGMLIEELFPNLCTPYQCFYFMPKDIYSKFAYHHKILVLRKKIERGLVVLPYQYGILVAVFGETKWSASKLLEYLELEKGKFYCGVSKRDGKKEELVYKIRESIYASNHAQIVGINVSRFENMGIWQVILPNKENYWMKSYCSEVVNKLKAYDAEGNSELYDTVATYVRNGCDISKTAEVMMVHNNTIRYRISKAKEVLELEGKTENFNESIVFAILFYENL